MHRRKLLQYLDDYRLRFPQEAAVVDRFVAFVEDEPRCFERDCWRGHVTGSAWLVDPDRSAVLLTHHRKLNIWVQLGGHSDGDPDTLAVAQREAEEESGLQVSLLILTFTTSIYMKFRRASLIRRITTLMCVSVLLPRAMIL